MFFVGIEKRTCALGSTEFQAESCNLRCGAVGQRASPGALQKQLPIANRPFIRNRKRQVHAHRVNVATRFGTQIVKIIPNLIRNPKRFAVGVERIADLL